MDGVVIDTNVFVAAGFNAKSASARILAAPGGTFSFGLERTDPVRGTAPFRPCPSSGRPFALTLEDQTQIYSEQHKMYRALHHIGSPARERDDA
jgi:hypothetical protein